MFSPPGVTSANYVSYFCSPYHHWFVEMGYPLLDVNEYADGEWEIIQYFRTPVVPALTSWNRVLMKMRHVEKSPWVIQRYTENLDMEKRAFWEGEKRKEAELAAEQERRDRHAEDVAQRQFLAVRQNPALMDRIARNGLKEIGLRQMARHIPNHFYR